MKIIFKPKDKQWIIRGGTQDENNSFLELLNVDVL